MILSKDATRVLHQSSNCIDEMIQKNIENYELSVVQECYSDHFFVTIVASKIIRKK